MTTSAAATAAPSERRVLWPVVTRQELRDLWVGGRGLALAFLFTVLVSVMAYLSATNEELNFLERREAVNLTLQVAVFTGALLVIVVAADTVSGERERGTLEALLLTPAPRRQLLLGKLLAALSFWAVAFALTVPYVWFLGRQVGAVGDALGAGLIGGTLLAVAFGALGIWISTLATTNRLSLSLSLLLLLALYAPTQLPAGARQGWLADILLRVNPVTATEHYIGRVVIAGRPFAEDAGWLLSPVLAAVLLTAAAVLVAPRAMTLAGGSAR